MNVITTVAQIGCEYVTIILTGVKVQKYRLFDWLFVLLPFSLFFRFKLNLLCSFIGLKLNRLTERL